MEGEAKVSILKKIVSAVRGGASELGELIVDSNGTRIFEQEIRDAENYLRKEPRLRDQAF